MSDGAFHQYMLNNSGKVMDKWLHYADVYELHFSRFRGTKPVFVEIGVSGGGSLPMWKHYFGEGAKIIGIDINPDCKAHEEADVEVVIGSQDDPAIFEQIFGKHPSVDIVLDDGSHHMHHMISSFELAYQRISPTGVYMVEDTHTCYWPIAGGGLREPKSFIEYMKGKVDELHASYMGDELRPTPFSKTTRSVSFYDSIVAIERQPQGTRQRIVTSAM